MEGVMLISGVDMFIIIFSVLIINVLLQLHYERPQMPVGLEKFTGGEFGTREIPFHVPRRFLHECE
jgi:hypothetical protein